MPQALIIAQFAIQYGIPAARELIALFKVAEPTEADWEKVFSKAEKPYEDYLKGDQPSLAK